MTSTGTTATPLDLPVARLDGGRLEFATATGADDASDVGAFLLRAPDGFDPEPPLRLCRNFYRPADPAWGRYRGHREAEHPGSALGYEDRPDQVEQLQIEDLLWDGTFPAEVAVQLERLRELTLVTLEELLRLAGIRSEHRETVTGGARARTGLCYSTINHYRAGLDRPLGIVGHTDSGFITVIHADQPGFEIDRGDGWRPVTERPGHLVVNTGDAFEVLTADLDRPVRAVLHRVVATHPHREVPDRSSFTVYMGPRFDMPLYRATTGGSLTEHQAFRDFSVEKAGRMGYEFHSRV